MGRKNIPKRRMRMNVMNIVSLLGGLGMLLFGIKTLGDGLEKAAGQKMKHLMEVLTRNKFMCVLVGALVTAGIQSSTATTLMVVGFVNANLLPLTKAVGVIMGANIGTTLTSLLLSVNLDFGAIFGAIAAIFFLIGKKPGFKLAAKITVGLALLFVGMGTMKAAMLPLTEWDGFRKMILFASNPIVGALVGALITALLHSSAASVGILQALAASGAVSLKTSLFILFGTNIGTCVTALVSSVSANRTAKRAAMVHLLFNLLGTVLFIVIALVLPLDQWIMAMAGQNNFALQVALAHVIFNVVTTLVLLPLSSLLEKLACILVPGQDAQEEGLHLQYFDKRLFSTPPVAVQQLFKEVLRMSELVKANFRFAMDSFFSNGAVPQTEDFDQREEVIDYLNAEITQNLIDLKSLELGKHDNRLVGSLFHVVNDLERIGDHSTNIVEIAQKHAADNVPFSATALEEITNLSGKVSRMVDKSIEIVKNQSTAPEDIGEVVELEAEVDTLSEELADEHVQRVKDRTCSPKNGMLYLDMLNNLERIGDHADNLASSVDDGTRAEPPIMW